MKKIATIFLCFVAALCFAQTPMPQVFKTPLKYDKAAYAPNTPGATKFLMLDNQHNFVSRLYTDILNDINRVTEVSAEGDNGVIVSVETETTTPFITIGLGNITPTSVAATGTVTGSNLSGTNTGDNAINTTSNIYADNKIVQTIINGQTSTAPSQDAVHDALAALEAKLDFYPKILITDVTSSSQITGTTTETIVKTYTIPANTFSDGNITFLAQFEKLIGYGGEFRVYITNTNSIVGATSIALLTNAANGIGYQPLGRTVRLNSGYIMKHNMAATTPMESGASYQVDNTQSINYASTVYVILTVKNADGSGWARCNAFELMFKKATP